MFEDFVKKLDPLKTRFLPSGKCLIHEMTLHHLATGCWAIILNKLHIFVSPIFYHNNSIIFYRRNSRIIISYSFYLEQNIISGITKDTCRALMSILQEKHFKFPDNKLAWKVKWRNCPWLYGEMKFSKLLRCHG